MTKPVQREERLQKAVVQHLLLCLPPDIVWFHVPNGGARSPQTGARLKAQGVRAGVADLAFILPGGQAAFIELKVEKSYKGDRTYLDKPQKKFRTDVRTLGGKYALARSIEEVSEILESWGVMLRNWGYRPPLRNNERPTSISVPPSIAPVG